MARSGKKYFPDLFDDDICYAGLGRVEKNENHEIGKKMSWVSFPALPFGMVLESHAVCSEV